MFQILFFVVWSTLMAGAFYALQHVDVMMMTEGQPIANLIAHSGKVQVRHQTQALWSDVIPDQIFYEGSVISTGPKGRAIIRFLGGRELRLDEDTQIALTSPFSDGTNNRAVIAFLLKGQMTSRGAPMQRVAANVPAPTNSSAINAPSPQSVEVRSGQVSIALNDQSGVKLAKSIDTIAPQIQVLSGIAKLTDMKGGKSAAVNKKNLNALSEIMKGINPMGLGGLWVKPVSPNAQARAHYSSSSIPLPEIVTPRAGTKLWALRHRNGALPGLNISLRLIGPGAEQGRQLRVGVGVAREGAVDGDEFLSRDGDGYVMIPGEKLSALIGSTDATRVRITPLVTDGATDKVAGSPQTVTLISAAEVTGGPFRLDMHRALPAVPSNEWVAAGFSGNATYRASLRIASAQALRKVLAIALGPRNFTVTPAPPGWDENGVFFLTDGIISAQLSGDAVDGLIAELAGALGAQIVYRGSIQAYQPISAGNAGALKEQLKRSAPGDFLHLVTDQRVTELSRPLVDRNPAALDLAFAKATAVFVNPVQILRRGEHQ